MEDIARLFDDFATAYRHSLYAVQREQNRVVYARKQVREQCKKRFEKARSKASTLAVNNLTAAICGLKDSFQTLNTQEDSIIKAAEYLSFGTITPKGIDRLIFSDCSFPWIMPFLGHNNVYIESNGDACQRLGLQFVIHALKQTAPGQLFITVINPEIRPEFSVCTRLPGFKMITREAEIRDELSELMKEFIQNDQLLQGKHSSLVALRNSSQQPIGKLRLLVIQDMPKETGKDLSEMLGRLAKNAPRAGTAILHLNSKSSGKADRPAIELKGAGNFWVFTQSGETWNNPHEDFDNLLFAFPSFNSQDVSSAVSDIVEASKNTSVITIPFDQIENTDKQWAESAVSNLEFNLGKAGLDTVSVCIGDQVTQHHNILISGAAGKGKSNLIEVMIHSLCTRYSPDELELYLLDFKDGLTFKPYASFKDGSWLPHAKMLGLESDRDVGLAVLKDLETERRKRAALFGDSGEGVHDYESYRKRNPDKQLPRVVLVIDEYQKLFDVQDDISQSAADLLENIVRQGRACAIHVILASQSITGTTGLLNREDRIYAQFPIRIALQNTLVESYSIFGIGNDAAATLRVRGEAVINDSYGAIDSNRRFVVAYAASDEMKKLRRSFCKKRQNGMHPIIFAKKDTVDYSTFMPSVKRWRDAVTEGLAIRLPYGLRLSVTKEVLSATLSNDLGRNTAILGGGEDLQAEGAVPGRNNMAIGILQGLGISLALQHPNGDARFVLIDGLASNVRRNSNMPRWLSLMERFGFPVEVVSANDAAQWLIDFRAEAKAGINNEDTYILGFGMDRCSNFHESDLMTGVSGAEAFQELLKYGAKGVHVLGWWSSVSMYKDFLGFSGDGYFGTTILLRMDTDTARNVLGIFVNWSVRDNRAYIHDTSDLAEDYIVIPMMPVTDRICGKIEAEAW